MIQADVEMILAIAHRGRRNIVLIRRGSVGKRIEGGDGEANRVPALQGNRVAGKGKLGEKIDGQEVALGEIAYPFQFGGNVGDAGDAFAQAAAFVIAEEERAVSSDGTARGYAELVALVLRTLLRGRSKEVARIQSTVPEELVGRAVELIGAGPEDDVHLPAGVAAERGVVGAGRDLELAHGVHGRRHADTVQLGIAVEDAVQEEVVGVLARAVDVDGKLAANRAGGTRSGRSNAGKQEAELVEIAPVERQAGDLAILDHAAERGGLRAQRVGRGGDLNRFRALTRQQRDADLDLLVQPQRELLDVLAIALVPGLDPVFAGRETRNSEAAQRVSCDFPLPVRFIVNELDHRAGDRRL